MAGRHERIYAMNNLSQKGCPESDYAPAFKNDTNLNYTHHATPVKSPNLEHDTFSCKKMSKSTEVIHGIINHRNIICKYSSFVNFPPFVLFLSDLT